MARGKFITFEGGEGAGKSTQIRLLADWLRNQGVEICLTREPGGSPGAEEIRNLVLKGHVDRWSAVTEALLITAARTEHIERTITPALDRGEWVLCDRFYDSSIAYQGAGRGVGMERVKALQNLAFGSMAPDLTLILDLPVEVGLKRAIARESAKSDMEDRFERMDRRFHETLRQAFLDIAKKEAGRCVVLDANQEMDTLQAALRAIVNERFDDLT